MRRYFFFAGLILFFALASPSFAQERFDSGPNKGFKRAHPEQIIVEVAKSFEVQSVHGVIKDPSGESLLDADFEIRDTSGIVRGATTDKMGRFKFSGVAAGIYSFKVTRNGFQSVVGKIVVAKKSDHKASIELTMPLGV